MATQKISGRIMTRIDTAARWTSINPVLLAGELGIESDTHRIKAGDGKTAWTSLPYLSIPADVTVSILPSGSSTWIEVDMDNMVVGGTQPTDQNSIWMEVKK